MEVAAQCGAALHVDAEPMNASDGKKAPLDLHNIGAAGNWIAAAAGNAHEVALAPAGTRCTLVARVHEYALMLVGAPEARYPWLPAERLEHAYAFTLDVLDVPDVLDVLEEPGATDASAASYDGGSVLGVLPSTSNAVAYTMTLRKVGDGHDGASPLWTLEHIAEARVGDGGDGGVDGVDGGPRPSAEALYAAHKRKKITNRSTKTRPADAPPQLACLQLACHFAPEAVFATPAGERDAALARLDVAPHEFAFYSPRLGRLHGAALERLLVARNYDDARRATVHAAAASYERLCARTECGFDTKTSRLAESHAALLEQMSLARRIGGVVETAAAAELELAARRALGALASVRIAAERSARAANAHVAADVDIDMSDDTEIMDLIETRASAEGILCVDVENALGCTLAGVAEIFAAAGFYVLWRHEWSAVAARLAPHRHEMAGGVMRRGVVLMDADAWSTYAFLEVYELLLRRTVAPAAAHIADGTQRAARPLVLVRSGLSRAGARARLASVLALPRPAVAHTPTPKEIGEARRRVERQKVAAGKRKRENDQDVDCTSERESDPIGISPERLDAVLSGADAYALPRLVDWEISEEARSGRIGAAEQERALAHLALSAESPPQAAPLDALARALCARRRPPAHLFATTMARAAPLVLLDPASEHARADLWRAIGAPFGAPPQPPPSQQPPPPPALAPPPLGAGIVRLWTPTATSSGFAAEAARSIFDHASDLLAQPRRAPSPPPLWGVGAPPRLAPDRVQFFAVKKTTRRAFTALLDDAKLTWRGERRRCPWRGDTIVMHQRTSQPSAAGRHVVQRADGSHFSADGAVVARLDAAPRVDVVAPRRSTMPPVVTSVLRLCEDTSVEDVVAVLSATRNQCVILASGAEWARWCALRALSIGGAAVDVTAEARAGWAPPAQPALVAPNE